jgi:CHAD domain-containing protein
MLAGLHTKEMNDKLKAFGQAFAQPRELDVFVKRVVEPARRQGEHRGEIAPFAADMRRRRKSAFADAKNVVTSRHFQKLVLETLAWIEAGDWTRSDDKPVVQLRRRPIEEASVDMLDRLMRKISKQADKLGELEPRPRHKLRIKTKKLRYGAEFFASVFPAKRQRRRRRKFLKRLKAMQDGLGDLNDIAVHERLTRKSIENSNARRRTGKAFAAGTLAGGEAARAATILKSTEHAFDRLAKAKRFWVD